MLILFFLFKISLLFLSCRGELKCEGNPTGLQKVDFVLDSMLECVIKNKCEKNCYDVCGLNRLTEIVRGLFNLFTHISHSNTEIFTDFRFFKSESFPSKLISYIKKVTEFPLKNETIFMPIIKARENRRRNTLSTDLPFLGTQSDWSFIDEICPILEIHAFLVHFSSLSPIPKMFDRQQAESFLSLALSFVFTSNKIRFLNAANESEYVASLLDAIHALDNADWMNLLKEFSKPDSFINLLESQNCSDLAIPFKRSLDNIMVSTLPNCTLAKNPAHSPGLEKLIDDKYIPFLIW